MSKQTKFVVVRHNTDTNDTYYAGIRSGTREECEAYAMQCIHNYEGTTNNFIVIKSNEWDKMIEEMRK